MTDHGGERRRRITRRLIPALAVLALIAGVVVGSMSTPASVRAGRDFARAWEQGHISSMYALLSDAAKRTTSARAFANAYGADADTATLRALRVTRVRRQGDGVVLAVVARTRIFGTIRGQIELPM